ncbi:MAG TPA: hypothetical protein DCS67_11445 [Clostridiales bacterium UBA8960]|jgi:hypothetical protein|nr:hypothetical protein [Clostridiales bacterium UBA8960]
MDESILKVMIEQTEDLPFTEEEIFKAVAENLDRIMTESDEACLLVTGPMALVLYWEGDKVIVERVMKADELKDNL